MGFGEHVQGKCKSWKDTAMLGKLVGLRIDRTLFQQLARATDGVLEGRGCWRTAEATLLAR